MATIKVDTMVLVSQNQKYQEMIDRLGDISSEIVTINQRLTWEIPSSGKIHNTLTQYSRSVVQMQEQMRSLQHALALIEEGYERTESANANAALTRDSGKGGEDAGSGSAQKNNLLDEFWKEYGWEKLLAGSGYIGQIYQMVSGAKKLMNWMDFWQFIQEAKKDIVKYTKIGRAVGKKKAFGWWLKKITGMRPLGRASAAKNLFTRFKNNLTNKTSPFNAQFRDTVNSFSGRNGMGKAAASWGSVAVNGVMNWFGNKEEQANSNGTMSDGRVVAETITETAVDTVLTYGASIVVGAAVTTALGTVAAPGVVVIAASGALIAGFDVGVKAITGKSTTEWISDTILDTGEAIGRGIKSMAGSVGSWFQRTPAAAGAW